MAVTAIASELTRLTTNSVERHLRVAEVTRRLRVTEALRAQLREHDELEENTRQVVEVLRRSALLLDMMLVAVCTLEALAETGAETFEPSRRDPRALVNRVTELTALDLKPLIAEATAAGLFRDMPPAPPKVPPIPEAVLAARTVVESCPLGALEALAAERGLEPVGHRCRIAYEGLRAFIRRRDPKEQERLGIVGREYVSGALSVNEVAALLKADAMDVIPLLEELGHTRRIETLLLGDDTRAARYASIREERLSRAGQRFAPSVRDVARDVVASERIEGVDARPWIKRDAD